MRTVSTCRHRCVGRFPTGGSIDGRGRTWIVKGQGATRCRRGGVAQGYGKVADAFRRNFDRGSEIRAAMTVYRDGVKVVDLWGGYRSGNTRPHGATGTRS